MRSPSYLVCSLVFAAACGAASDSASEVATLTEPQLDPSIKSYALLQQDQTKAIAWAGLISTGQTVEYWVAGPSYQPSAARIINGNSQSCQVFKRQVCGSAWAGATYYKAIYTRQALDCGFPPGPCRPPAGAVSFLGNGSYITRDASGIPIAATYVNGACEYWSMTETISTGSFTQQPLESGYTSLSDFESKLCAGGSPPPIWYSVYYQPISDFCKTGSANPC